MLPIWITVNFRRDFSLAVVAKNKVVPLPKLARANDCILHTHLTFKTWKCCVCISRLWLDTRAVNQSLVAQWHSDFIGQLDLNFQNRIGLEDFIEATRSPLVENLQPNDVIGPFAEGISIRAELKRLGGHIEYYLLTVVYRGSSKILLLLTYAKSEALRVFHFQLGRMF